MEKRVRVRRERPSALSWAIALAATMLAVWLITLSVPGSEQAEEAGAGAGQVTQEVTLEGMTLYLADMGCYAEPGQARIAAAALAEKGAAGVVRQEDDGWHVLGAGYETEADAARIVARLSDRDGIDARVTVVSAEPVPLRVTATEAETAAVVRAAEILRAQLSQAETMALQMDRGELTPDSARTLAALSRSELADAAEALDAVRGARSDAVCSGLLDQLESLAEAMEGVSRNGGAGAALSGRLRCCHVNGSLKLMEWLTALKR